MNRWRNSLCGSGFSNSRDRQSGAGDVKHPPIPVAAAAILTGNGVVIARRAQGKAQAGLWELPGGKIEPGETPEISLVREIREELSIGILIRGFYAENVHDYGGFEVRLCCYLCTTAGFLENITIRPSDHSDIRVVRFSDLCQYRFSAADIPIVEKLAADQPRA